MGWDGLVGTETALRPATRERTTTLLRLAAICENDLPHCASPLFADTEAVTARSVAVKQHGDEGGPQTVVDEALVRTPNFTPHGRDPPAETAVRTAVGLLLTRTEEVRGSIPLLHPQHRRSGRDAWGL
jgi:hypothetical protein